MNADVKGPIIAHQQTTFSLSHQEFAVKGCHQIYKNLSGLKGECRANIQKVVSTQHESYICHLSYSCISIGSVWSFHCESVA
jgi:hypothetical protein